MKNQPFARRLTHALAGLRHALRTENSLRLQGLALLGIGIVLAVTRPGALWTALVLLAAAGVLATELVNTALEALADHLHPEQHPQIGFVKDCAAAAVLVASGGALAVGLALAVHLWG